MPVQRFDTRSVQRPSGLVAPTLPLTGMTELRLHGVGGTPPEDLLGDLAPQLVSGDRIAGFYRTADRPDRHVEAYSWGGLTSRSSSRVLWLLLFPFALANVAGWMCTRRTHERPRLFRWHRTLVRWAALGVTVNLLVITAIASMDLVAYQCGAQRSCAGNAWVLHFLRWPSLAQYPGRRVLVGALVPFLAILALAVLTMRSISRYEEVEPTYRGTVAPPRASASAAAPGCGLADRTFWDGRRSTLSLGCLHIAAALAFVALALAHTVHTTMHVAHVDPAASWLWGTSLVLAALTTLVALAYTARNSCPGALAVTLVALAVLAFAGAAWFALRQPQLSYQPVGPLPGMRNSANLGFVGVFLPLGLVLVVALIGWWRRHTFFAFGPFVALALAVIILNAVLLGVMIRLADWLGTVSVRTKIPSTMPTSPTLYVYDIIGLVTPYLTVGPLVLVLLFAIIELVTYWLAGVDRDDRDEIRKHYRNPVAFPRPTSEESWQYATVPEPPPAAGRLARLADRILGIGWLAGVARARRFARMPRDIDKLLTVMALGGFALLLGLEVRIWAQHRLPWHTSWALTAGSWLAAWLPLAVILLLRNGWRSLSARRHIGIIWDVSTFWPRAYHPLAPPSYAERAVPELQRRLRRIHDSGGRVVIAAHSQGSVIAAAALCQPHARTANDSIALVTFGSPVGTLYSWAFPAYFNDELLRGLSQSGEEPVVRLRAWRNLYYETDYVGRNVLDSQPPDPVDEELPDPTTCWYIYGQAKPAAGRHSGYWDDPAVWACVDRLAAEVAPAQRGPREPTPAPAALGAEGT